ncbi:MAG: hypothetical protein GWP03_06400 [Proteobacteria bacterium]|nr:hypothetical protein [Pseudomonadota bacterium]
MWKNLIEVLVAIVVSVSFNFIFIVLFRKFNITDKPDGILKPHQKTVPLSGGISLLLSVFVLNFVYSLNLSPYILLSLLLYFLIGFVDDIKTLNPVLQIILEIVAAFPLFFGKFYLWTGINSAVTVIFTVFLVLGCIDSFNLMDRMDGLSGTLGVVSLFSLGVLSCSISCGFVKSINMVIIPVIFGFLLFNYEPAKAFLGDGGAYFLGFIIAYEFIIINKSFNLQIFLASLFMVGIFIYDTFFTISRRLLLRRRIFSGDRSHVYDLLKGKGKTTDNVITIMVFIQILFSILGIWVSRLNIVSAVMISLFTIVVCSIFGFFYIGKLKDKTEK